MKLAKIKDISVVYDEDRASANTDLVPIMYEIEAEDGVHTLRVDGEKLLLDGVVVKPSDAASWFAENGYSEDDLFSKEEAFLTQLMKDVLWYEVNRDPIQVKAPYILVVDYDEYYVEQVLTVENIYDYYKHFYGGIAISIADMVFNEMTTLVLPDSVSLLEYYYSPDDWKVVEIDEEAATMTLVKEWSLDDVNLSDISDVEVRSDVIAFYDFDVWAKIEYYLGFKGKKIYYNDYLSAMQDKIDVNDAIVIVEEGVLEVKGLCLNWVVDLFDPSNYPDASVLAKYFPLLEELIPDFGARYNYDPDAFTEMEKELLNSIVEMIKEENKQLAGGVS